MAYDSKKYGASPFGSGSKATSKAVQRDRPVQDRPNQAQDTKPPAAQTSRPAVVDHSEALSDQVSDHMGQSGESPTAEGSPELPAEYDAKLKPPKRTVPFFYIPKGRVAGLTMLGEATGWLMAWGTVGFFRAYIPAPIVTVFDQLFTPWGMAGTTLLSALLIGQLLQRYLMKVTSLRLLATTAIEYGELHHRADTQKHIYDLLAQVEADTESASRWLVTWLTALGCLFIIGAFY